MRRIFGLLLSLVMVLGLAVTGGADNTDRFYFSGSAESLTAAKASTTVAYEFPTGFSAQMSHPAAAALAQRFNLSYEVVGTFTLLGKPEGAASGPGATSTRSATPAEQVPWGIKNAYSNDSLTAANGGSGIIVAVLDTGVAPHIDLKSPLRCRDFTGKTGAKNGCDDKNGHGTHVTGTVLAHAGSDGLGIYGVAPAADYFAYKVLNNAGSGTWDGLATGIREAADYGAHIITMSLGGSSAPEYVRDAIKYANSKGSLVIAAAGNSGPNADTIGYPAAFAEAVAVASIERIDTSGSSTNLSNLRVSSFSSRGRADSSGSDGIQDREVEVSAAGRAVLSTANNGGYVTYSGTSMATPHVAGMAARNWQGSHSTTRAWLVNQAKKYDITQADGGGAGTGYDIASGYGNSRVN